MTTLNVCAPNNIDPYDSYGLLAIETARHLSRLGVYVNLFTLGKREMDSQDEETKAVIQQPVRPARGGIFAGYPTNYYRHSYHAKSRPRIALTMWESSICPTEWIDPLNACDAVIVPSRFCGDVFAECGVTAPIHVVPLGVGEVYAYAERSPGRPLTFLAFLDRGARKGGLVTLQAFLMAFGDDAHYRLILKRRDAKVNVTLTNPNIDVIQRDMNEAELYRLYLSADVLVDANKGEGFGLLPREMAASGGISLSTNWSGTADGLDLWGWPLPFTLEKAGWEGVPKFAGQDLGEWAKVTPEDVAAVMRDVAEHIDAYRAATKVKAANARRLYSWSTFAQRVLEIYEEVEVGERLRQPA